MQRQRRSVGRTAAHKHAARHVAHRVARRATIRRRDHPAALYKKQLPASLPTVISHHQHYHHSSSSSSRWRPKHPDWDELWEKVQCGGLSWLRNYIKSHDINQCTDEHGNTLLHRAVVHNDFLPFKCLSHLFIDPNIKNAAGQTALQLEQGKNATGQTALRPWQRKDKYRLEHLHHYHLCIDFDKASTKPNGLDALFVAIYRGDATLGDTSGVENDGNEVNAGGWTALDCAAMYDRPHLIHELHQRFPKLDVVDSQFRPSALHIAAKYGHSNCIIALRECFPAIEADDVLHVACDYNRPACIPTLRQCFPYLTGNELALHCSRSPALLRAVRFPSPECVLALHSCFPNIDPNLQDSSGNTALIAAAGRPESSNCIPVLAECFPNIDPNKQDGDGNTASMHACMQGLPQSITSLGKYFPSIDVNMRNEATKTALMLAIEPDCDEKCIIALSESFPNLDPNVQNWHGETALMLAVGQDNEDPESIISQLLKSFPNIDPNVQDKNGWTALMFAVRNYYSVSIMSQLREAFPNMDPNKQDKDQNTALMHLMESSRWSLKYFLETFPNVDVNIPNK